MTKRATLADIARKAGVSQATVSLVLNGVANARIAYSARGALAEANTPGWLTRFFTHPLFPL